MAFDHYIAICCSLHYSTVIEPVMPCWLCGLGALLIPLYKWPLFSACSSVAQTSWITSSVTCHRSSNRPAQTPLWWSSWWSLTVDFSHPPVLLGASGLLCGHPVLYNGAVLWRQEQGSLHMHHTHYHCVSNIWTCHLHLHSLLQSLPSWQSGFSFSHSDLSFVESCDLYPSQQGSESINEEAIESALWFAEQNRKMRKARKENIQVELI